MQSSSECCRPSMQSTGALFYTEFFRSPNPSGYSKNVSDPQLHAKANPAKSVFHSLFAHRSHQPFRGQRCVFLGVCTLLCKFSTLSTAKNLFPSAEIDSAGIFFFFFVLIKKHPTTSVIKPKP